MLKSEIKKIDYIDAIRGIAIIGVIVVHASQCVSPTNKILLRIMEEGARGVQLFYIASALTLCMSWESRSSNEKYPIRNFYIRRIFRIVPMFYIAILSYMLINGFAPGYWYPNGIKWWYIPLTATFLHGVHPETINSIVPGGWSIAVEMSFYAILPLLLPYIKSIKSCLIFFVIRLVLFALNKFLIPYIFIYPEPYKYLIISFSYMNFFGQLPIFIIGVFCYLIIQKNYPRKLIAIICGSLFVIFFIEFWYPQFKIPHHIIAGALFSTFVIILANWPKQILVNKITTIFGKLSFSLYLTHFAILKYFALIGLNEIFFKSNLASILYVLCVVFIAMPVSLFFYHYIEKNQAFGLVKI